MTKPFFVRELRSSMDALGDTLKSALAALVERGWVESGHTFYAQLCLEEALVNAITHGNQCNECLKVRIEMTEEGEYCLIRVYDQGAGFTPERVALPNLEQLNGRGVCLIRYCMDEVSYNHEENCLEMKMRRNTLCKGGARHE
ncbi:MAG: ATP-binding protein [Candidatus Hydrogenedentes bacterium]|nr:ATP-binding protein [Candidatus Hydrogenedentota bacterium]